MGYKILGYFVWQGAKRYLVGGARRAKRDLVIAGAGALLLAGAGTAVALKRGGGEE